MGPLAKKNLAEAAAPRARAKQPKPETPIDRLKLEIAIELGLEDKLKRVGWGGLSAAETGRIGGLLTKRMQAVAPR